MFLPLFLPPLLFTAGLNIEVRRLMDEVHAVLLLAIVAVVVCIASVGVVVHWATGMDLVVCLLLGAVVSTTDPAAVIGIFRDVGAPKRLSILAEGESLLNDAVAIAAFGLFIGILVSQVDPSAAMPGSAGGVVVVFLREFVGGLLLGFLLARAAMLILPRLGDSDAAIASVTVSARLSLLRARRSLSARLRRRGDRDGGADRRGLRPHASAPARMVGAAAGSGCSSNSGANCLIFVLASMLAANVLSQITWLYVWALAVGSGGRLRGACRLVVFGMLPLLELGRLVQPVDNHTRRSWYGAACAARSRSCWPWSRRATPAARGHARKFIRRAGDAVRAVHAVRQRTTPRPVDAAAWPRQAHAHWSWPCATACWRCRGSTSRATCADHPRHNAAGRRHGRRPGLGRRGRGRGGAGRTGARPRRAASSVGLLTLCPGRRNSISSSSSSRSCRAAWSPS